MKIRLICIGTKMPDWVSAGYDDYQKRLTGTMQLELIEIPLTKRSKGADIPRLIQKEGQQMLAAIPPHYRKICLDVQGKILSTEQLAGKLQHYEQGGYPIALLVGGPEGLASECLAQADERWSLSALTLPHPLVRIVLAEQIYRCASWLAGHPYHR